MEEQKNGEFIPFYSSTDLMYKDGKRLSTVDYIFNLKSIMEKDFNKQFDTIEQIEEVLEKKQEEEEWKYYKEQIVNNLSIKEKIVKFLSGNKHLRKIYFVDKMLTKQIKMLPLVVQEIINESNIGNNLEEIENVNTDNSASNRRNKFVENINIQINEENLKLINNEQKKVMNGIKNNTYDSLDHNK